MEYQLIRFYANDLRNAFSNVLAEREELLRNYLKETQEIDVDQYCLAHGVHGLLTVMDLINVDEEVARLTSAEGIIQDLKIELEEIRGMRGEAGGL